MSEGLVGYELRAETFQGKITDVGSAMGVMPGGKKDNRPYREKVLSAERVRQAIDAYLNRDREAPLQNDIK